MKILNKLTLKNLRLNKSRTIVTIIGILLSTALITTVAGMAFSAQQTMIDAEIKTSGDYEIKFSGADDTLIKDAAANRSVENIYASDEAGCAYLPEYKNKERPFIGIIAYSKDALSDCFKLTVKEGRYPQSPDELLLSESLIKNSDKKYSVGDSITLEVGTRYSDQAKQEVPLELPYGIVVSEATYEGEMPEMTESLVDTHSKTYTIVGIANESISAQLEISGSACLPAYTYTDLKNLSDKSDLYVDIKPECEKDYMEVTAQLAGIDEDLLEKYISADDTLSEAEAEEIAKVTGEIYINLNLLRFKGYCLGDNTTSMLYWLAGIIIAIIIVASVFVIRNSFAISITEKTKLYGMLASVGATSKQIRNNVLFEGVCLGVIGIPLGLLLGAGVIAILVTLLNLLLAESLNGINFVYIVPTVPMIFAVIFSALIIFLSSLSSAVRTSKISPVDAIRSNKDIKIKKKQKQKHYNSPKIIKKLFGTGGDIAYKNLKRSKKKYRTTVISIVVSVSVFIAMAAFLNYGNDYTREYYEEQDYNIAVNSADSNADEVMEDFEQISKIEGVNKSYYSCNDTYISYFDKEDVAYYNPEVSIENENGKVEEYIDVISVSDSMYKEAVKELGLDYDDVKDKGILYNVYVYNDENGVKRTDKAFNIKDGEVMTLTYPNEPSKTTEIQIAKTIDKVPKALEQTYFFEGRMLVSDEWMKNQGSQTVSYNMYLDAEDADEVEQKIYELELVDISVYNTDRIARQQNSLILIFEIFIYGFIAVISLIGITNIFNTITTSMKLRSKEFAMLKSIGMTKKEFNRMIRLESLFYGAKSLIIGIPLGLLGAFGIYYAFTRTIMYDFVVPWSAILISVLFVFIVVWMIMKFSISKVKKQNIIETIRNDNI